MLQVNTRIFSLTTCAFAQRSQDEVLSLGLEEAFFLSYALEALVVKYQGNFLTLEEMCDKFTASASNFLSRYVVYHHFRCKGWVVKYGLKFATDYGNLLDELVYYQSNVFSCSSVLAKSRNIPWFISSLGAGSF